MTYSKFLCNAEVANDRFWGWARNVMQLEVLKRSVHIAESKATGSIQRISP